MILQFKKQIDKLFSGDARLYQLADGSYLIVSVKKEGTAIFPSNEKGEITSLTTLAVFEKCNDHIEALRKFGCEIPKRGRMLI